MKIKLHQEANFAQLHKYVSDNMIKFVKTYCDTQEMLINPTFNKSDILKFAVDTSEYYKFTISDVNFAIELIIRFWAYEPIYFRANRWVNMN